jgi:hypothetical protein
MSEAGEMGQTASVLDRDVVVTRLLAQTADDLATKGVHKTTLTALLLAAADNPDSVQFSSVAFEIPVAALNESLLRLRLQGKIELTSDGFTLTDRGRTDSEASAESPFAAFLKELVGRKLREWQLTPTTA